MGLEEPPTACESESHSVVSDSLRPHGLYSPWNSLGQNTGMGSLFLLQGIFPTQGSNPGFSHCRRILCQPSHQGSPRILESVAYPFSRGSSWARNHQGLLHGRWILYQLSYRGSYYMWSAFIFHGQVQSTFCPCEILGKPPQGQLHPCTVSL